MSNSIAIERFKEYCFYTILVYLFFNFCFTLFVIKEILLYFALFLFFVFCIKFKRFPRTFLDKPIFLFLFWSFISIFYSIDPGNALHDVRVYILMPIFLYYLINTVVDSKAKIQLIIYSIVVGAVFWCIIGLIYFFLIQHHKLFIDHFEFKHIHHCLYPFLTVPVFILSFHLLNIERQFKYKILYFISCFVLFFSTLLTLSRGGIIALVVSAFLFVIKRWKFIFYFLIILLFLIIISLKIQNLDSRFRKITCDPRFNIWLVSLYIIKDKPLTGWGFSGLSYSKIYQKYSQHQSFKFNIITKVNHPHNFFIDIMVKLGITGLVIFLYLILKYLYLVKKLIYRQELFVKETSWALFVATISIIFCALYDNFWNRHIETLFFTLLGLQVVLFRISFKFKS